VRWFSLQHGRGIIAVNRRGERVFVPLDFNGTDACKNPYARAQQSPPAPAAIGANKRDVVH
jgi:hypothetical protein